MWNYWVLWDYIRITKKYPTLWLFSLSFSMLLIFPTLLWRIKTQNSQIWLHQYDRRKLDAISCEMHCNNKTTITFGFCWNLTHNVSSQKLIISIKNYRICILLLWSQQAKFYLMKYEMNKWINKWKKNKTNVCIYTYIHIYIYIYIYI